MERRTIDLEHLAKRYTGGDRESINFAKSSACSSWPSKRTCRAAAIASSTRATRKSWKEVTHNAEGLRRARHRRISDGGRGRLILSRWTWSDHAPCASTGDRRPQGTLRRGSGVHQNLFGRLKLRGRTSQIHARCSDHSRVTLHFRFSDGRIRVPPARAAARTLAMTSSDARLIVDGVNARLVLISWRRARWQVCLSANRVTSARSSRSISDRSFRHGASGNRQRT